MILKQQLKTDRRTPSRYGGDELRQLANPLTLYFREAEANLLSLCNIRSFLRRLLSAPSMPRSLRNGQDREPAPMAKTHLLYGQLAHVSAKDSSGELPGQPIITRKTSRTKSAIATSL